MVLLWGFLLVVVTCVGCGDLAEWNARLHGVPPVPSASLVSCPQGQVLVNGCCQKEKAR